MWHVYTEENEFGHLKKQTTSSVPQSRKCQFCFLFPVNNIRTNNSTVLMEGQLTNAQKPEHLA